MSLVTTLRVNNDTIAHIEAVNIHVGPDGVDTYRWEWGMDLDGCYRRIDEGQVQHRESDGAITLLALILEKMRGRKAVGR